MTPRARLLVVDDQASNLQVLYRVLGEEHQVLTAKSGEQALALALAQPPDLVLLDLEMPGLDGFEVCARLQAEPRLATTPVIFVTAHADEATETRGLAAGAVDFISKPIRPAIVQARVRTQLTLKRQADQLRALALVDGLTGLANRRAFDAQIERLLRQAEREHAPLALALIDVDHFKRYNDHYGHPAGDACLVRVAQALQGALQRPIDLAARYGGEEFACLLPGTTLEGALAVAERARAGVQALGLPHATSATAATVSISVGVVSLSGASSADAATLLRIADEALYAAKDAGRNRVQARSVELR